jgi:RNA polymerase sigma factor (sigma-70 family)
MAHVGRVVGQLRQILDADGLRDGDLVSRFAAAGDEAAFAALVERHGPLVFGLCRRVLQSTHDAEDAFQATFLVLARRASSLRREGSVAGWIYGVAYRVARKMKTQRGKRGELERKAPVPAPAGPPDLSWRELQAVVDEELQRLPETQRQPLLLCYLQGLTQEEAAARLGWPRGTLKRRLERGRDVLRGRLTRRGLSLAAALVATLPAGDALAVPPPTALSAAVPRAAALFALNKPLPAKLAAAHVVTLAEGVLRTMLAAKLKWLVVAVVALPLLMAFAAVALYAEQGQPAPRDNGIPVVQGQVPAVETQPPPPAPAPAQSAQERDRFQGAWRVVEIQVEGKTFAGEQRRLTFRDGAFTLEMDFGNLKGTFAASAKDQSHQIDFHFDGARSGDPDSTVQDGVPVPPEPLGTALGSLPRSNWRGDKLPGIYEFEGKFLTICLTLNLDPPKGPQAALERPRKLAAKDKGTMMFLLQRVEADPPPPKDQPKVQAKGDAAKLQGVWDIVEVETMKMPAKGNGGTVTFDGEDCIFQYAPNMVLKAKFKLDETKDPRWIDLGYYETTNPPGLPPVATPTVGAYKLEGDKLTLGLGSPAGSPESNGLPRAGRPVTFDTSPGTGAMVLRLVRRSAGKPGQGKDLSISKRWTGFYGSEHNQVRLVIRDEKQWEAAWAKSMGAKPETPHSPEPQPLEKVDFSKHMVLAVFMGDRENGGHVTEITRIVATADGWTVWVREKSPPPGGTPKVTQQPFCLVVVPRFEGRVTFVNEDQPDEALDGPGGPPKVPPGEVKGEDVPIRKLWTQEYSRWQKKGEMVARTADEWKVAWARASAIGIPVPELPAIDAEREMMLAVFMGTQPSGAYSVKITRVVRTELELYVYVRYTRPAEGELVTEALTYPSCVAIVPRFNGKVVFVKDDGSAPAQGKAGELPIRKQWVHEQSVWQKKGEMVARDADALKVAWERTADAGLPVPPLPEIDLEKEMALAVFMGMQGSSGCGVKITRVVRAGEDLEVYVRYTRPAKGQITADIETYPSCFAIVPRFNGKVVFKEEEALKGAKTYTPDDKMRAALDKILVEVDHFPASKLEGYAKTIEDARRLARLDDRYVWQFTHSGKYGAYFIFCQDENGSPTFRRPAAFVMCGTGSLITWQEGDRHPGLQGDRSGWCADPHQGQR